MKSASCSRGAGSCAPAEDAGELAHAGGRLVGHAPGSVLDHRLLSPAVIIGAGHESDPSLGGRSSRCNMSWRGGRSPPWHLPSSSQGARPFLRRRLRLHLRRRPPDHPRRQHRRPSRPHQHRRSRPRRQRRLPPRLSRSRSRTWHAPRQRRLRGCEPSARSQRSRTQGQSDGSARRFRRRLKGVRVTSRAGNGSRWAVGRPVRRSASRPRRPVDRLILSLQPGSRASGRGCGRARTRAGPSGPSRAPGPGTAAGPGCGRVR